jgi:hypothetical protein
MVIAREADADLHQIVSIVVLWIFADASERVVKHFLDFLSALIIA